MPSADSLSICELSCVLGLTLAPCDFLAGARLGGSAARGLCKRLPPIVAREVLGVNESGSGTTPCKALMPLAGVRPFGYSVKRRDPSAAMTAIAAVTPAARPTPEAS